MYNPSAYRREFDEIKYMFYFLIKDQVWKVIKKGFDSEHIYNQQYSKTKVKSYEAKVNTNFS